MNKIFVFVAALLFFFLPGVVARAATFSLTVASTTAAVGDKISVTVAVTSSDVGFNAAQAVIKFPRDLLEVAALDHSSSVFNFWLEEPSFSNERGLITFIGGSSEGLAGEALTVLRIIFQTKRSGAADLLFSDGAVTASDGSGTNILTMMRGVKIAVLPQQEIIDLSQSASLIGISVQKVKAATKMPVPSQPRIEVAPYADPSRWYRAIEPMTASWSLPPEVADVAAVLNKTADFAPAVPEGRIERKEFLFDGEGVWYLHVRFKNAAGWGPTAHHRIQLDATPPVAIHVSGGEKASSHPQPTIAYLFGDLLSGINHYRISIDGSEPEVTTRTRFTLPLQSPGRHQVAVTAFDRAGNETTENLFLTVVPLTAPTIASAPRIILLEDLIRVQGTAPPETASVKVVLKNSNGGVAAATTVRADPAGSWQKVFPGPSIEGNYFIEAIVQDQRGAQSEPVRSAIIKVRKSSFLNTANVLIGVEATPIAFAIGSLGSLLTSFLAGWYLRRWYS